MSFQIIRNDITKVKADAIVNTANPEPMYGSGTDAAIYEAAGCELLLAARKKIGNIARGQAVETPAFGLNARYIIHTVGPIWKGGDKGEFDTLKACYENSLRLALKLKCKSIAFPLISTGIYGFPKDRALQTAMSVIQAFLMKNTMKVILVVFDKKAFELSGNVVENIREYVNSNYVEKTEQYEYDDRYSQRCRSLPSDDRYSQRYRSLPSDDRTAPERGYRRNNRMESGNTDGTLINTEGTPENTGSTLENTEGTLENTGGTLINTDGTQKKISIDELIAASDKTFQEKLFEIIDERGLTGPKVYKNYISKQVFSKIQADRNYHPNKFTALALCLSLQLDIDQTQDLIGRAGWTLSPSNKADLVIRGCIMNHEYNLVKINCILFDFNCPEFEKIK